MSKSLSESGDYLGHGPLTEVRGGGEGAFCEIDAALIDLLWGSGRDSLRDVESLSYSSGGAPEAVKRVFA